jgi:hypothetical protein
MVASLCGLRELIRRDPAPYRNLAHYFTNILKQVGWLGLPARGGRHGEEKVDQQARPPALLQGSPLNTLLAPLQQPPPLLQAAEGKLGRAYEYHRAPAPFVQLELLRLLGMLGAGDRSTSENMYAVVAEVKRRAEPLGNNIGEGREAGRREARRAADIHAGVASAFGWGASRPGAALPFPLPATCCLLSSLQATRLCTSAFAP